MAILSLLKTKVLSFSLWAARLRPLKPLVIHFFKPMVHLARMERLTENAHWVAFHHPQPDYPTHILILPKQPILSLTETPGECPGLYDDLFHIVQTLISDFELDIYGYRLITNGGPNQRLPLWHWHLISDHAGSEHA